MASYSLLFLILLASCQVVNEVSKSAITCSETEAATGCGHTSPPNDPAGLTLDRSGTNNLSNLPTFSWSLDTSESITGYEVALGSFPGANDILSWTSVGKVNSYKFKNLALTQCRQYYPSVRVRNSTGKESTVSMASGFTYDQVAPIMNTAVSVTNFDGYYDRTVTATWDNTKSSDNCENFSYQFAVGSAPGATDVLIWKTFKAVSRKQIHDEELSSPLNLQRGNTYYTSLRIIDAGGNLSSSRSSEGWHFYDPLEINGLTYWGDFSDSRTVFKDPNCTIRATEVEDNVSCIQDRAGRTNVLLNSGATLPRVSSALNNINKRLSMTGTFLESNPLSVQSMIFSHQHANTNVGWNYLMDWRNTIASSWWAAAMVGAYWNGLYLNGTATPVSNTVLFNNKLNITYIAGAAPINNAILHLGSRFTENEFSHGEFGEIFIFSGLLSNSDRQNLEGYLACKWGNQASLPNLHPFKNACPL